MNKIGLLGTLTAILLIAGCGPTKLTVEGDFPPALTRQIPLVAGVYFDKDFSDYTYIDGDRVAMSMGDSQKKLFKRVLGDLFQGAQELQAIPQQPSGVDLVISPHIEEVQLAMPKETQLKVFEVWIKYNIQVFDGSGTPVADWIMTSYGKTVDRLMSSDETALNQATIMALRDVGAQLITRFARVPEVRRWLEYRLSEKRVDDGGDEA